MTQANQPNVPYAAWVALDWADQKHYWDLRVADATQVERGELPNTPEAVEQWACQLAQRFGPDCRIAVAIEQTRGAVVAMLSKYAHLVIFLVPPSMLANYRKSFYPSGAKSDPGDTDLLLEILDRHRERLRPLQPDTPETRSLQFLGKNGATWGGRISSGVVTGVLGVGWSSMNRILVIGSTGTVGRQVLAQLAATGAQVRALTRRPDAAGLPPQVEAVRGDLTRPETLDGCLGGIDVVFLVWTAPPATVAAALERIARHAGRIVFLSAPLKTAHPLFQQPNPARVLGEQIERLIETSGLEWTFLRPGMFAANALRWWAPQIRAGGDVVRWPYAAASTAPIHERDIAAVAVRALCEDGHAGAEYVLTGPQSLSQSEQIAMIGDVIGRSLRMEEISREDARPELLTVMPGAVVNMLLDAWGAAIGLPALVTATVAEVTGRPALTFGEWAMDHAGEFRA